jgi:hypothetical protein
MQLTNTKAGLPILYFETQKDWEEWREYEHIHTR